MMRNENVVVDYDAYCPAVSTEGAASEEEKGRLVMLGKLARTAHELHKSGKTPYRHKPDGRPYIVHPAAVVELLGEWGYTAREDFVTIAVGWGHDLIEETVDRVATERSIREALAPDDRLADEVVNGIRRLSFEPPADDPMKSDAENRIAYDVAKKGYVQEIADEAPIRILVVKMADRLCNTRDFVKAGNPWAKGYLELGLCLFDRMGEAKNPQAIERALNEVKQGINGMQNGGRG